MQDNFYSYQQRRLGILFFWGLGSVIAGLLLLFKRGKFWRQFALQQIIWGAIDAAIAYLGLNGANKKEERAALGELNETDELQEARNFRLILLVNAVLDTGYFLTGVWLIRRFKDRRDRQGIGAGFILQGLYLFIFDSYLAREVRRLWKA